MKKIVGFYGILCICFLLSSVVANSYQPVYKNLNEQSSDQKTLENSNDLMSQDGQSITKLQWFSPSGVLPGTYQEYVENHPLSTPFFYSPQKNHRPGLRGDSIVSLLVNESLYPQITTALNQYIADLESEGYTVVLQTVIGGTPETIKTWVKNRYSEGCSCFVFIGDITAAWAEVSGDVFPSDLFYMDLDGSWVDADGDGDYEQHTMGTGDMGPEVYVGRIYASTLSYDSEANMVNEYLDKAHRYRTGELTQPWRSLEYVEEDWFDMDLFTRYVYGEDTTRHDYGYYTTAQDYLNQMDLGQHFVQVCVHSYSGGHFFSTRPTESTTYTHTYVYSPSTRSAKLLVGSDDGVKVWLNGENVLTKNRWGGWSVDAYQTEVTLSEGWNQLLCKVSQDGGDHLVSVRFTDTNYETFDDLFYQINSPQSSDGEAEFIRSWLLNGFHQDSSDNFWDYLTTNYLGTTEAAVNPSSGDSMGGKIWTTYHAGCPYIDLSAYDESDFGLTYAYARVYADSPKTCELWMGYDDGARVWLNGNEVVFDNRYGGYETDMKKISVNLQTGMNRLLVKVSEWMGAHGFSARFCQADGSAVSGLTYDPEPEPISYIGVWLVNGPYVNPDKTTRLSTDYLSGEATISPSEGDLAPLNTWQRGIGNGKPFDLGSFYDHGDWVLSEDIQSRDPQVLFYNLFACGPGRFTDENYLAGAYVFHTTYGLITIASSKSGSMLNFDDFYTPLNMGKSIGESFRLWFDAQAPYVLWEQEWYYGMAIFGDPTLTLTTKTPTSLEITKPGYAIYLKDQQRLPFFVPVIVGDITIEANASNPDLGITHVSFYIDDVLQNNDTTEPYSWVWDSPVFFRHTIKIVAYDSAGSSVIRELPVWKFF